MQAVHRADVRLIDMVVPHDLRIGHVRPVVSPEWALIWCPSGEAMHQDDRIVVRPAVARQMVVRATILGASDMLLVQTRFFPFIKLHDQLVEALNDESEHRDVQVAIDEGVCTAVLRNRRRRQRVSDLLGCFQDLVQQDYRLFPASECDTSTSSCSDLLSALL